MFWTHVNLHVLTTLATSATFDACVGGEAPAVASAMARDEAAVDVDGAGAALVTDMPNTLTFTPTFAPTAAAPASPAGRITRKLLRTGNEPAPMALCNAASFFEGQCLPLGA